MVLAAGAFLLASLPSVVAAAPLPGGLSALFMDSFNATGQCAGVCFGAFSALTPGGGTDGQVLVTPTVPIANDGYASDGIDAGLLAVSPTAIYAATPSFDGKTNTVYVAPLDGSPARSMNLTRGQGWPPSATDLDIFITQLDWDSEDQVLYALLTQIGQPPGVGPTWSGYCVVDTQTGAADWLGEFPLKGVMVMVGGVSGYDPAARLIYSAGITIAGHEMIWAFSIGDKNRGFRAEGSWHVGGAGMNNSLAGLAINKGQPPVAVVNPIVATAGPNQGKPAGGPRLLSLLENGQLSTLYDYGPFTAEMILQANLGCVIGAANAVVMLLDDGTVPTPPWNGHMSTLAVVPLDHDTTGPQRWQTVPTFSPDDFAGLVYHGQPDDEAMPKRTAAMKRLGATAEPQH